MKNIDEITEKLAAGVTELFSGERFQSYLDCMNRFHDYSINNTILIWLQNPNATYVAGYKSWIKNFNRQVRKGEKGIQILAPCPHKYTKEVKDEEGNITEQEYRYNTYRPCTVFDISQTDGEDLPEICTVIDKRVDNYEGIISILIGASLVPVSIEQIDSRAYGWFSHTEKRIAVKAGMPEAMTIKTLVHEISHAMLHDGDERFDKNTKEVQAESVAYVVCSALGLDTSDYSFGYVAGWSKGREAKELVESMDTIKKTANILIDTLKVGVEAVDKIRAKDIMDA